MIYFLTNNFLEIFKANPIAIKWTKAPNITPKNKSSRIIHTITNVKSEGIVTINAIIVPFNAISRIDSFVDSLPVNDKNFKNGNKNQRLVRKYCPNFYLIFVRILKI